MGGFTQTMRSEYFILKIRPGYLLALGIGIALLGCGMSLADYIHIEDRLAVLRMVPILEGIAVALCIVARSLSRQKRWLYIVVLAATGAFWLYSLWQVLSIQL
jgi:hypothetical protein